MPEIVKRNLGKFLLSLSLMIIFIIGFLLLKNFSVRAQEEIKILPESFSVDPSTPLGAGWQNPEAVFSQDLSSEAALEEFNQTNSAYPITLTEVLATSTLQSDSGQAEEIATTTNATTTFKKNSSFFANLWGKIKSLFDSEVRAETSVCQNGANQPCSSEIGACQIGVQICQDGAWGQCLGALMPSPEICDGVDNNCSGQIDEGLGCSQSLTCEPGSNRPCGSEVGSCQIGVQICQDGVWGQCLGAKFPAKEICDGVDNDCDGIVDEKGACSSSKPLEAVEVSGGAAKVLTLSGFGITPFENTKIKLAQLKLSLAGKGRAGDKLAIDYFYNDVWYNSAIFDLANEISNNLNGGYFLYGLPIFENWSDLDNLRIRFTYTGAGQVFLDSLWLEVDTEQSEPFVQEKTFWQKIISIFSKESKADFQEPGQFGTNDDDYGQRLAVDASENIYVTGFTNGALPDQANLGFTDAFLMKYDSAGNLDWLRQFGTIFPDRSGGIALDSSGVYVSGQTGGTFAGQTNLGQSDVFLRKYDFNGNVLWTRQFGAAGDDSNNGGAAADSSGVYVAAGSAVYKYDAAGNFIWKNQSAAAQASAILAMTVGMRGLYIAGEKAGDAFLTKMETTKGDIVWTRRFGTDFYDEASVIATDADGVYAGGFTEGAFTGQNNSSGGDAFIAKYDYSGKQLWLEQFGNDFDVSPGQIIIEGPLIYMVGEISGGALSGQTEVGSGDAFLAVYDNQGNQLQISQFGTSGFDKAVGAASDHLLVYIVGYTAGKFSGETSSGKNDIFLREHLMVE